MTEIDHNQVALRVLEFLGELYNINANFCRQLWAELASQAKNARAPTSDVVCRAYKTGVTVHVWVEAMLTGENSLTWELDISNHDEGWLIDARVSRVDEKGTNTLLQFADEVVPTFADLEREVPRRLGALFEAGMRILKTALSLPESPS